jgi:rhodanese-related sulfurtransferase
MVAAAAACFAFTANQLSPRGLNLARDYFPASANPSGLPPIISPHAAGQASETDRRIKEKGLQPIDHAQAERLFHDPRCQQGVVVFVDAREEASFTRGHIPGAFPLDRYHPEKDLAADLTSCQNADLVVVYCEGGDCEDAEYTALLLRDAGVPAQKLLVYGGGFDDWSASHLPLEQGERNGGIAPAQTQ